MKSANQLMNMEEDRGETRLFADQYIGMLTSVQILIKYLDNYLATHIAFGSPNCSAFILYNRRLNASMIALSVVQFGACLKVNLDVVRFCLHLSPHKPLEFQA